jgi:DNA polymerase III psi subunit
MNKAFRDIANGRGDTKTHVSKIIYYGTVQAVIFTALQNALFAVIGTEDDDEKEEMIDKKSQRMLNSMIDTWLSTFGYSGKAIGTIKNTIIEYDKQRARDVDDDFLTKSDHAYTLLQATSFSPPISSKLRKIYQSIQTEKFNRDLLKDRGFKLDNPVWSMIGNVVEATTNIPLGRLSKKLLNIDNAMDSRNQTWQRIALMLGWSTWDVGIKDPDLETLKLEIKEQKKQEKELEKEEIKEEKLKLKYPDKTEEEINIIVKSKELFSLSKQTQVEILKALDLSDKQIKELKKEKDRTDYIANKYKDNSELINKTIEENKNKPKEKKVKKEKIKLSKSEQYKKDLFKMKKQDQINKLMELGYPTRKIYSLRYEKDRVEMIIKLESKKSK